MFTLDQLLAKGLSDRSATTNIDSYQLQQSSDRCDKKSHFITLGAMVLLAGCGSYSPPGTAEYKSGYYNGCMHGYALESPYVTERDETQFTSSADYRSGWQQGHGKCTDDALSGTIAEAWHP